MLPQTDPSLSAFINATKWVEGVLLGSVGNTVAVIAIALLGFSLLTGHTDLRRGGQVLLGCFVLFGAGLIARGLMDLAGLGGVSVIAAQSQPSQLPTSQAPPAPPVPSAFDPYAGASVPN